MKRALFLPLIVLLLATMACSLTGTKPTAAPAEPTKEVVAPKEATKAPAKPAAKATDTEAAPVEEQPTEAKPADEQPTEAPAEAAPAQAEGSEFKDTFDKDTQAWSDPLVVTSQAPGRDPIMKFTVGSGIFRWGIHDKETYAYKFLNEEIAGATQIQAKYTNKGALNTSIALICQANADRTSWYELRLSGYDNSYHFYKYDKQLKEVDGKNPYVELSKGIMKYNLYSPMKPATLSFTCTDSELAADINGGKITANYPLDNRLEGNTFGFAVMSADVLPVNVEFDSVTVK